MIYRFAVGRLSCAVVSDGQMEPPLAPPLEVFFTPDTGVPDRELREALAAEGRDRTRVSCGYNCLLVEIQDGRAVIDTGLGRAFSATARGSSRWSAGSAASWPRRGRSRGKSGQRSRGKICGTRSQPGTLGGCGELSPPRGRC